MSLLQILILALVQGITEFLPISSSGHLILVPALTGWPDQGYVMDLAVHVGTLFAVLLYFWQDSKGLALAGLGAIGIKPARRAAGPLYSKLFWALVISTIPVVIIGGLLSATGLVDSLRTPFVIATTSIVFGLLLLWADRKGTTEKTLDNMAIKPALLLGLAQMLALIPGTSRSGITLTAGRWLGFNRTDAARFAMLMSIPTILAGGTLAFFKIMDGEGAVPWMDAVIAAVLAFISALIALHFLMKWLQKSDTAIFVYYRVALGLVLYGLLFTDII